MPIVVMKANRRPIGHGRTSAGPVVARRGAVDGYGARDQWTYRPQQATVPSVFTPQV
jgi:hypothetical protein